jgi:peptidylprolyl isomerase
MLTAKNGDTVKVAYTGKFEDGTVFDSSAEHGPMEFTIGKGQVVPGFENAIIGMELGDLKTATIAAGDAYGEHREDLLLVVDRDKLPADLNPAVGEQLELRRPDGQAILVTIAEVTDTNITLDANHPLAGKNLVFEIELKAII